MQRYYFNHRSSENYIRDEEGSVHLRLDDALREGYESARQIMTSQISMGRLDLRQKIEIVGDTGTLLATIVFSDAASASSPSERRSEGGTRGQNDRRKY